EETTVNTDGSSAQIQGACCGASRSRLTHTYLADCTSLNSQQAPARTSDGLPSSRRVFTPAEMRQPKRCIQGACALDRFEPARSAKAANAAPGRPGRAEKSVLAFGSGVFVIHIYGRNLGRTMAPKGHRGLFFSQMAADRAAPVGA